MGMYIIYRLGESLFSHSISDRGPSVLFDKRERRGTETSTDYLRSEVLEYSRQL